MADSRPQDPDKITLEYPTISARDQERIGEYLTYRRRFENADDATLNAELLQLVDLAQHSDGDLVESTPATLDDRPSRFARSLEKFHAYADEHPD